MQVERLRLAGFKSFVEPTELTIAPGLTGIVGPNGCGKSNLVEALRWVMGEGSARRLRGGEMDDVIFAGSAARPARNLAEVMLTIDNAGRDAPFAYNDNTTIEVVRRIGRGSGSTYRISGREARARDVQLLFADAASGPHSGALVGQGRIGALITAKPTERRVLLDEAAGTAGLHARRHEAELKLQATEANLVRLDDVVATLAAQIETLRKQARQARRYRRLGELIRRAEAELLIARWRVADSEAEGFTAQLRAAERSLAAATEAALMCDRERTKAETALPDLRLAQATAAAAVQRLNHAREALEAESTRIIAAHAEAARRREQIVADLEREAEQLADAVATITRLVEEQRTIEARSSTAGSAQREATARVASIAAELAGAEVGLQQMAEACAAGEARRAALEHQRRLLAERQQRLKARLDEAEAQRAPALQAIGLPAATEAATRTVDAAAARLDDARAAATTAAESLITHQRSEDEAAERARETEHALARLKTEAATLERMLAPGGAAPTGEAAALSLLEVPPGFEAAVAALFDGELSAPILPEAARPGSEVAGWIELPPLGAPELPAGAQSLADKIGGPPALARRLAHTGWVDSEADGWRAQAELHAGQSLVDRTGRLWRWDGFARPTPGSAATAEQLRQRNRLAELGTEIATATPIMRDAARAAQAARARHETAADAEREAIAAVRIAEEQLAAARAEAADLAGRQLAASTRLAAINDAIDQYTGEIAELTAELAQVEGALARLPDPLLTRTALDAARAQAAAARRRDLEARAALDRLEREEASRAQRLAALAVEAASWQKRQDSAGMQRAILSDRQNALDSEIAALADRPAAVAAETEALTAAAAEAAAKQRAADDALAGGETRLRQTSEAARQAELSVAEGREQRAGAQARCQAAAEAAARLRAEIAERFEQAPEQLIASEGEGAAPAAANSADLAAKLERLLREREMMGPVNLLAEQESEEVEARLERLDRERADVTAAIARLRRGIATLNQEGRKRILAAFAALNHHFGELFKRLFGGGKAMLAWDGDGDPLEDGLEIMASPPGKRLETLSLLSGGEQALTAIALIFAAFLTNPAPICVLDEVDAPLDDHNVDGFCRLVAEIADATATRFLIVTHHRVTMARMDRLYGVTMAERGVSQLVSVDLAQAAELRQSA